MTPLMKYQHAEEDLIPEIVARPHWTMQQKLDGMRIRLVIENDTVTVLAGNGGPSKSTAIAETVTRIHQLGTELVDLGLSIAVQLDGEVMPDGTWWIFDVPHLDHGANHIVGHHSTWHQRLQVLGDIHHVLDLPDWIEIVPTAVTPAEKQALWDEVVRVGGEGVIAKAAHATVRDGKRVDDMVKVKRTHTIDCIVLERGPGNGVNGKGNWIKLGLTRNDGTVYEVGRCSTIGKPVAVPGDVVEVKYLYAGNGGRLTQPTHLRNRYDKDADQCGTDQLRFVSRQIVTGIPVA